MRKLLALGLGIGLLVALSGRADAFGCHGSGHASCYEPCVQTCVTYVDQCVTCYRPEWREEKFTYTVNRIVCKELITKQKCTKLVAKYYDEKRVCHYTVQVPKCVEYDVQRCRMVCVQVMDPCTGCCYTCCRPEYYCEKVQATVYECRPASREYMVKVCRMEPVVYDVDVRRVIQECVPEVREGCRRICHMVPYQTTVRVPVCVPCCPTPHGAAMPPAY
jgi:hypothetical protein